MCHCLTCNRFNMFCDNPSCPNSECDVCRDLREELAEAEAAADEPPEASTIEGDGSGRR